MIDRPLLAKRLQESFDLLFNRGVVHTITDFAKALGKSQGDISNALAARGRVMTMGLLERVADTFSEYLNKDYLLTGEGRLEKPGREMRPHFHAKAAAGFINGIAEGEYGDDMHPVIPFLRDYDFTIGVEGESMLPDYKDGDILACRISHDRHNPPIGKVCVIDSKDGAAVKQIASINESNIVCHSLNPDYQDFEVEFSNINQIAVVVGAVRDIY